MRLLFSILFTLTVAGCSSDGGGGGSTPQQKCEALFSVLCDRVLECVPGEYASKSECITDASQVVSCENAVSVTENYQPCIGELKSSACSTLFPAASLDLPAICSQVILTD